MPGVSSTCSISSVNSSSALTLPCASSGCPTSLPFLSLLALILLYVLAIIFNNCQIDDGSSAFNIRYWLLVPGSLLLVIVYSSALLYGVLSLAMNPPLDRLSTLWDCHSKPPCVTLLAPGGKIPFVGDLPLTLVNDVALQRSQAK